MFLQEILARKRVDLADRKETVPLAELQRYLKTRTPALSLSAAISRERAGIICEIKKASPSKGLICRKFDPPVIARAYFVGGAIAVSVLTEEHYFQGSLDHLKAAKAALGGSIPVLRKDFILDPYQVYEARAYGADALLLIVAALKPVILREFLALSHYLGMECLVEVHDEVEVETAVACGARIIGINNRSLATFNTDLMTTMRLRPLIPADRLVVAESGFKTRADVQQMKEWGADAVLIGEALMNSPDTAARVRELRDQD